MTRLRPLPGDGSPLGLALRLLAPYIAVVVFWVGFRSAWLAILAYHTQILLWLVLRAGERAGFRPTSAVWLALPSALAGPAVYYLLPYVVAASALPEWMAGHSLTGLGLLLMVPYYGLIHPTLEQLHWAPLRARTPLAHLAFAGYHVIVLASLLAPVYVAASFGVLLVSSVFWERTTRREGSLLAPILSHSLADLGMIVAALLLVR